MSLNSIKAGDQHGLGEIAVILDINDGVVTVLHSLFDQTQLVRSNGNHRGVFNLDALKTAVIVTLEELLAHIDSTWTSELYSDEMKEGAREFLRDLSRGLIPAQRSFGQNIPDSGSPAFDVVGDAREGTSGFSGLGFAPGSTS
ncbi:MAG TPA: hypothetical protein PKB15_02290 [Acidimicrobiia bacterium]|nr:hypothetical protein [Acidimicrobiia bacterium]